jgi:hypothetical protein
MDKKQFIEEAAGRLDNFYELLKELLLSMDPKQEIEIVKSIKSKERDFDAVLRGIHQDMQKYDIQESDDVENKLQKAFSRVVEIFKNPKSAVSKLADERKLREERALQMRSREPISERDLGPVNISGDSKEQLEEKLFKAHEEKQQALNPREKEEAQKKIDHLLRLYRDSALHAGLKKKSKLTIFKCPKTNNKYVATTREEAMEKCQDCGGKCQNVPVAPTMDFFKKKIEENRMNRNKKLLKKRMLERKNQDAKD